MKRSSKKTLPARRPTTSVPVVTIPQAGGYLAAFIIGALLSWKFKTVKSVLPCGRRISNVALLLCSAGMLAASVVRADEPVLSSLNPPGAQRGTVTEIQFKGARLADAREVLIYHTSAGAANEPTTKIDVTELVAEGDNLVKAKLTVPADFPPGLYGVRLATATGLSDMRYLGITPLPQFPEVEPNSDFDTPQVVDMNSTLVGVVTNEDVDYFAVELTEGQTLTVELEGLRLGTEFFDPSVTILDDKRFEVASSDDAPLLQQDCICSMQAPRAGRYLVEVRESSYGGNERCQYRVHIGGFPRPLAVIPSGGRPGELLSATVVDASGQTWTEQIQLPDAAGDFEFIASREGAVAPSPNRLRVIDFPNVLETEPDNDPATLVAVDSPVAFNGVLQEPSDVDWFKLNGKKDQTLEFTVYARRSLRSPTDSWLEIYNAGGGLLASNDDSGGPDSLLSFKFPEDGVYLVAIRDQLREGSPLHAYRIEVAPPQPSLSLGIDELVRYQSQIVEVPQGASMAVVLRAQRANFGGDLNLFWEEAPAGLQLSTNIIAAKESFIPLLITAAADAPLDAALAPLRVATPVDSQPVLKGALNQRTQLVSGQNRVDMWGHNADRLAVAVTEPMPFTIELVQPQVPLVRNGSANFQIKVKRNEGYNEPISLRVLYNSNGCAASGSVRVEPDQSEALVPVTANANAEIGSFPMTMLAQAKRTNGSAWVATNFINFEVADSFFDYQFVATVVEPGASNSIAVGLQIKSPPDGEVDFELLGLPAGITSAAPVVKLEGEMTQLTFPISVAADARVGKFQTLVIKATIRRPAGEIVQTQGTGEVQIVAPVPTATPAVAAAPAAPPPPPTEKPLSRLEQLRQAKLLLQTQ